MRLVSSITTVKNYDNALNNLFNSLTFSNLDSDINLMKRKNKSDHSILMVLKSIVFYIKYHLKYNKVTEEVNSYIKNKTLYLKNPAKIHKNIDYRYILKFYSDAITQYNIMIKAERCTKINNKNTGEYPKWEKLINVKLDKLTDLNKHIYNIYTLMPFRRLEEYVRMVFVFNESEININKNREERNNFCYINKQKPDQSYFYFIIHKTDRFQKDNKYVKIWKNLLDYLLDFIKTNNIKSGDKFLKLKDKEVTSNASLVNRLKNIFGYSVDVLRHSYIQYIHNLYNQKIITYEDLEEISDLMGHKIEQQIRYYDKKF